MMKTDAIEKIKKMLNPKFVVLHLPIKGAWFKMIAAGIKKEEYREITTPDNYASRNVPLIWGVSQRCADEFLPDDEAEEGSKLVNWMRLQSQKHFDILHLTAGYGHDKPQLWAVIESITIGTGNPAWGAEPGVDYFVIKIGQILHTKNFVLQSEPSQESNV